MPKIGLIPMLAIAVVLSRELFNVPLVWSVPLAALVTCVVAYLLSRERLILTVGTALVTFAGARFVWTTTFAAVERASIADMPLFVQNTLALLQSDNFFIALSIVALVLAVIYGIFGPLRGAADLDATSHTRNR